MYVPLDAEVIAELMLAVVTDPPETVLHADVTHCVRVGGVQGLVVVSPLGRVAGNPDFDQSIARPEDSTVDHGCAKIEMEIARRQSLT